MFINEYLNNKKSRTFEKDPVIRGTKAPIQDIIDEFPDGVTITDLCILDTEKYGVLIPVNIKELDDVYFYSPSVLKMIILDMMKECGYSITDYAGLREDLKTYGGMKIKLENRESKSGNKYIGVRIL